ncbi:Phospholipase D [Stylosanthes scabra]|uniref:Phospholipase D n=1 Tax=Stylosanthes scabra TaxID=79078 RepID=A0ABU6QIV2_9FABA|nr:Phospholipase D [Stylosanthes scabra]
MQLLEETFSSGQIGARRIYTTIKLGSTIVGKTRAINQSENFNFQWHQSLRICTAHVATEVVFHIKEDDPIGAKVIGRAYFPVEELVNGENKDIWLQILNKKHKPLRAKPRFHVRLQFFNVTKDVNWSQGIKSVDFAGLTHSYFPQRTGCRVTLYQDTHIPNTFFPEILLSKGRESSCKKKEPSCDLNLTLGELLIKKADEGVKVLMLVWDDRTSIKWLKNDGVMTTHDEDTESYFNGSGVHCALCPRNPDKGESLIQGTEVASMFTHHQKIVIVDSDMQNGRSDCRRRILRFIGGIDLCDGRYDTPFHSIFGTLGTIHHDDFHQPNFEGASIDKGGPREPWHDIHCRLEGPIARDVLKNFEQRWRKQGKKDVFLVEIDSLLDTFVPAPLEKFPEDNEEAWNVQLFRSIDGGAALGLPNSEEEVAKYGLMNQKDNIFECSIQNAYIAAYRRAKSFIYIENQYFMGSSFDWNSENVQVPEVGALHLIPKELSLKIVSKIEAGERFSVYIVIPMWPEGIPESNSVQSMLSWQKQTMDMMYSDVIKALQAKGISADPKDYLSFFCLGNREKKKSGEYEPSKKPQHYSDYSRTQEARRFMIYVHAKMMIVDDEYIIIGSANINQRSIDGSRDTEIAMGAYQPCHISRNEPSRGQIHGFRMALWYEHLGFLDGSFLVPQSLECVRLINNISTRYWDLYCSETLDDDLPGHLLSYPIKVTECGKVTTHVGLLGPNLNFLLS